MGGAVNSELCYVPSAHRLLGAHSCGGGEQVFRIAVVCCLAENRKVAYVGVCVCVNNLCVYSFWYGLPCSVGFVVVVVVDASAYICVYSRECCRIIYDRWLHKSYARA